MKDIFPKAVHPPKLVKPYGVQLGFVAASVSALFAIVHMFRIDTLVPLLDEVVPGGSGWASTLAVMIVLAEVFALPFALRMKLSPLAHILSGYLLMLAPLLWLLISIWAAGTGSSTGQLGEFVHLPSSTGLVLFNAAWLGFAFYTLYALGYNRLKLSEISKQLRK